MVQVVRGRKRELRPFARFAAPGDARPVLLAGAIAQRVNKLPPTAQSAVFRGAVYGRLFTAPKGAVECRSFVLSRAKCADASNLQNLSAKATTKRRIRFRVVGKGQTD